MNFISTEEAAVRLGLSCERELLNLIFDKRFPRPRKVFGWENGAFEVLATQHGSKKDTKNDETN